MVSQPTCVLPGCGVLVEEQGAACADCLQACGPYLVVGDGPPMSADEQRARDSEVVAAYRLHATPDHAPAAAAAARRAAAPARKANQRCWLCEERHTCVLIDGRWECDPCRRVT